MIKPAVEELLRFANPVQAVNRYASVDIEIGGVPIPKGSHVMLVVAAANPDSCSPAACSRQSLPILFLGADLSVRPIQDDN